MHRRSSLIAPTVAAAALPLTEAAGDKDCQPDWGTMGQRRPRTDPRSQGDWNIFHTGYAAPHSVNAGRIPLRTAASTPRDSAGRSRNWYEKRSPPGTARWIGGWKRQAIAEALKVAMDHVVDVPTGFLTGVRVGGEMFRVVRARFPVFRDVREDVVRDERAVSDGVAGSRWHAVASIDHKSCRARTPR